MDAYVDSEFLRRMCKKLCIAQNTSKLSYGHNYYMSESNYCIGVSGDTLDPHARARS